MVIVRKDVKFVVDPEKCCGCRHCVRTCQEGVWQWDEDVKCAVPRYAEDCVQCYQCMVDCMGHCFEVVPLVVFQSDPLENTMGAE